MVKNDIEYNYAKILEYMKHASDNNVDIVAFPESVLTGYLGCTLFNLESLDLRNIMKKLDEIARLAKKYNMAVVTSQYIKRCGKWFNNAVFFGKNGKCYSSYDKNHLTGDDIFHVCPGSKPHVFNHMDCNFSLGICHDIRYPEVARIAAIEGTQVHIHPFYGVRHESAAKKVQRIYHSTLICRAVENGIFIVAPNVANNEQMLRSQIVSPTGEYIVISESWKEDCLIADIDYKLAGNGWVKRRRNDAYEITSKKSLNDISFFERGFWQDEYYMNKQHNETAINYEE